MLQLSHPCLTNLCNLGSLKPHESQKNCAVLTKYCPVGLVARFKSALHPDPEMATTGKRADERETMDD